MLDLSLIINLFLVGILPAAILSYWLCSFLLNQYYGRFSNSLLWTVAMIGVTIAGALACALLHLLLASFAGISGVSVFSSMISGLLLGFFCTVVVTPILLLWGMKLKDREEAREKEAHHAEDVKWTLPPEEPDTTTQGTNSAKATS